MCVNDNMAMGILRGGNGRYLLHRLLQDDYTSSTEFD